MKIDMDEWRKRLKRARRRTSVANMHVPPAIVEMMLDEIQEYRDKESLASLKEAPIVYDEDDSDEEFQEALDWLQEDDG